MNRAERRFVARRAQRKLMEVGLADQNSAGFAQARDESRVTLREVPCSNARGSGRRKPFDVDQIFDGYRSAMQRAPRSSLPQLFIEFAGLLHRLCLEDRDERIER